jgi:hypothetical protein
MWYVHDLLYAWLKPPAGLGKEKKELYTSGTGSEREQMVFYFKMADIGQIYLS